MRTTKEVNVEIKKLKKMLPNVRQFSIFRDDNHASIEAQIEVLEDGLDENDIFDREEAGGWPEYVRVAASGAFEWVEGDNDVAPSKDWECLVEERTKS